MEFWRLNVGGEDVRGRWNNLDIFTTSELICAWVAGQSILEAMKY